MNDFIEATEQWLLIAGNPIDGFQYVGPFATPGEAHDEGERNRFAEYWIAPLDAPSPEKEVAP